MLQTHRGRKASNPGPNIPDTFVFKQMNLSLHKMIKQTLHISNGFFPPFAVLLESLTPFLHLSAALAKNAPALRADRERFNSTVAFSTNPASSCASQSQRGHNEL